MAYLAMENVGDLANDGKNQFRRTYLEPLLQRLESQRRKTTWFKLDALEVGVASSRPRLFVLAGPAGGGAPPTKQDLKLPAPAKPRTQREVIGGGFVDLDPAFLPLLPNEYCLYRGIPGGKDYSASPLGRKYASLKGIRSGNFLRRRGWDEPANCIMASVHSIGRVSNVHPGSLRRYSVGEAKALLGVPQKYWLAGPPEERLRQLGNGVAPEVARIIATAIVERS